MSKALDANEEKEGFEKIDIETPLGDFPD